MDLDTKKMLRSATQKLLTSPLPEFGWAELTGLGWIDAIAEDPADAIPIVFDELGRTATPTSMLNVVALQALKPHLSVEPDDAVIFPPPGTAGPGGRAGKDPSTVSVRGLCMPNVQRAKNAIVLIDGDGFGFARVPVEQLQLADVGGVDPAAGWQWVRAEAAVLSSPIEKNATAWPAMVAATRLALGHEVLGLARQMLTIATEHVAIRHQFGKPLGTFQAVKHRLAGVQVAITAAEAVLAGADPSDLARVTLGRILAGRAHDEAARHCYQVCGAMAFTEEFGLQRFIRRGMLLDSLLGPWRSLEAELGVATIGRGRTQWLAAIN